MPKESSIAIQLVVLNGEKYLSRCLESIANQTYNHNNIELLIWDNGSSDNTLGIIENSKIKILNLKFAKFSLIKSKENLGMWPAHEALLKNSQAPFVLVLSVDVVMDENFIANTIKVFEEDETVGAIQPKIFQFNINQTGVNNNQLLKETIDTCGFAVEKSRRIINIGHGEKDGPEYEQRSEVFAVEGACPVFRRSALEDCRISGKIIDDSYFWYGDDLDLAWRMRLFGWKEIFSPSVVAWHDRSTTKGLKKSWLDHFSRFSVRREIPIKKRRLDWRNVRFTIIKNDYIINILKDLPFIAWRELMVFGYTILFEPKVLLEIPALFRGLPKAIRWRKEIMKKAKANPSEIRKWFK